MRGAVPFLNEVKERFDLEYTALIDLEPASMENGAKTIYTGSVGKTMPAVLVQGVKAHVLNCFHGVSSLGVLSSFFMKTELAPEFAEKSTAEICPPPTWFCLRDRKEGYDVSVPFRAGGYMSMLGFENTPDTEKPLLPGFQKLIRPRKPAWIKVRPISRLPLLILWNSY